MSYKNSPQGFSAIEAVTVVALVTIISLGGWWVWKHNHAAKKTTATTSNSASNQTNRQAPEVQSPDLTENGKYLVIKEWNIKVALPQGFRSKAAYIINSTTDPDTGLPLQAAKIYIADNTLSANDCATTNTSVGVSIESGAQYIRSDTAKAFNIGRYKGNIKDNVLTLGAYAFHANYTTPSCLGEVDATKITMLQGALLHPQKAN